MAEPWPTELRLDKERRLLSVTFDDGKNFALPAELLRVPNVDGALVGGASLKADDFLGIAAAYS